MHLVSLLGSVALGALAGGCVIVGEPTGERGCGLVASDTANTNPDVVVLDQEGNALCGARVVVRDGAFEQTLAATPGACHHFEMPDRAGAYEVTIEREGHETFVARNVPVGEGSSSCIGPAGVVVRLERVRPPCDAAALMSFQITVRDPAGVPVCDASIVVSAGDFVEELRPVPGDDGTCTWAGPVERPGTYVVTVSKAGYETLVVPAVVTKEPGDCHVVPAEIDLQLRPLGGGCPNFVSSAFVLYVFDELENLICDGTLTVRDGDFEEVLGAPDGECAWRGAVERAGTYDLAFVSEGYLPAALEDVVVKANECNVETALVSLTLTPEGPPPAGR
jgi:hypothetical protein